MVSREKRKRPAADAGPPPRSSRAEVVIVDHRQHHRVGGLVGFDAGSRSDRPDQRHEDRQDGDEAQDGAPVLHVGREAGARRRNQDNNEAELEGCVGRQPAGLQRAQQLEAEKGGQELQRPGNGPQPEIHGFRLPVQEQEGQAEQEGSDLLNTKRREIRGGVRVVHLPSVPLNRVAPHGACLAGGLVYVHNHGMQFRIAAGGLHAHRHPGQEAAQDDFGVHPDDGTVRAGHAAIGLVGGTAGEDAGVSSGDVGVGSYHGRDAAIQVPAHGHLFTGHFGVEIHKLHADGRIQGALDFVGFAKRTVGGGHNQTCGPAN